MNQIDFLRQYRPTGDDFIITQISPSRLEARLKLLSGTSITEPISDFDAEMTTVLSRAKVKLICLAGFMRLLSRSFVEHWYNQIINIHPSLLPAFKGLDVQTKAIEAGAKFSGCTVHFVAEKLDNGRAIIKKRVWIKKSYGAKELKKKVQTEEYKAYSMAIRKIYSLN